MYRIEGSGFKVSRVWLRVLRFRVYGLGFSGWGGCRVEGLELSSFADHIIVCLVTVVLQKPVLLTGIFGISFLWHFVAISATLNPKPHQALPLKPAARLLTAKDSLSSFFFKRAKNKPQMGHV